MSKYTTEVRYICETNVSQPITENGFNAIDEIITKSRANIFNFDYPLFDEAYKPTLEKKILRHYYTREISEETVGLWKLRLCDKLNLIMPYYNQLYQTELLKFNPLYDVDYTKAGHKTNTGETTGDKRSEIVDNIIEQKNISNRSQNLSNETEGYENDTLNNTLATSGQTANNQEIVNASNTENNALNTQNISTGSETNSLSRTENDEGLKWDLSSDTPQGTVSNLDNNTYLTKADKTTTNDDKTVSESNNGSNSTQTTESATGVKGANSESTTVSGSEINTKNDTTSNTNTQYTKTNNKTDMQDRNETADASRSGNKIAVDSKKDTIENFNEYTEHVIGKMPGVSFSKLLKEFRETFLNIDNMVINELSDLFFGLW